MKTVESLRDIDGLWISEHSEVVDINANLDQWFESYFMVTPKDGGRSGEYELYGCDTNIPWNTSGIKGPFIYPK